MSKYQEYQEALDILRNIEQSHNYKQIGSSLTPLSNLLQELVDEKLAKPTEEEIKKEWEALGYEWEKREHIILIYNRKIDKMISIHTIGRGYSCSDSDGVGLWITLQEHQLLTKTFKMLGWEV